jgi:hypothetical protein
MPFKHSFLNLLALIGLTTLQACGQQNKYMTYEGDKFTLDYPAQWHASNENGILNFSPFENYGALTSSKYPGGYLQMDKIISPLYILIFSFCYFVLSVAFSVLWTKKFGRGPLEMLMRKIAG